MATTGTPNSNTAFPVAAIRQDFPILQHEIYGHPLVYFDNAATSQKPLAVIRAIEDYYKGYNANIHRGVHRLSQEATEAYEGAREKVRAFINAGHSREVNFVRGTTEAINLVAQSWGRKFLKAGDEIMVSTMEHHSNIVPWQMLCGQTGAVLKELPITDSGEWRIDLLEEFLTDKVKLVALGQVSNAIGTIHPVEIVIAKAHALGAIVLLDGAQAVPHMPVDVQALDADFYAFSGHKMCGPTGIGILYGKEHLLEAMDPYMGGGEMIRNVSFAGTTYNDLPYKFEAGTPNIAGGIGLGVAIDYLQEIGMGRIAAREQELLAYANKRLAEVPGMRFIGIAPNKASVVSFLVGNHHPYDVGVLLDRQGIAIRTGHHCTEPLMDRLGLPGTCRASMAFYNTEAEIDRLKDGLMKAVKMLG